MLRNTSLLMSILLVFNISATRLSADVSAKSDRFARMAAAAAARKVAEKDAKRDANASVNKENWVLIGAGTCLLSSVIGYGIGTQARPTDPLFDYGLPSEEVCTGMTVSLMTGLVTTLIAPAAVPIRPSPESLLGKTPVYIRDYTRAYKAETERIRRTYIATGACAGGIISALILSALGQD